MIPKDALRGADHLECTATGEVFESEQLIGLSAGHCIPTTRKGSARNDYATRLVKSGTTWLNSSKKLSSQQHPGSSGLVRSAPGPAGLSPYLSPSASRSWAAVILVTYTGVP